MPPQRLSKPPKINAEWSRGPIERFDVDPVGLDVHLLEGIPEHHALLERALERSLQSGEPGAAA